MGRPNQSEARREAFLPIVAIAFSELGYRRTTTAELARRCDVQETVLYRLWPDKRAMFVAAVEYVYQASEAAWEELLAQPDPKGRSAAERLIDHEAEHLGEFGLHRIVFAGLSESDDEEIRDAMRAMYRRFQRFILRHVKEHRESAGANDAGQAAWALLGLGTVANIARELELFSDGQRARLVRDQGRVILDGP